MFRANFLRTGVNPRAFHNIATRTILGKVYNQQLDITRVRIGQELDSPYETTVDDAWRTKWQCCFFQQDRLYTSQEYCELLKLPAIPMPFDMIQNFTSAMTHVDESQEVYELRITNSVYENPVYAGDTLTKGFRINDVRDTADGKNIVVDIECHTYANGKNAFSLLKSMMFTKMSRVHPDLYGQSFSFKPPVSSSFLYDLLLNNPESLPNSKSLINFQSGQLILHGLQRPLGLSNSLELAQLMRMIHPHITNTARYNEDDLLVPGGQMIALTFSSSARELYEILHQTVESAVFVNKLAPRDPVGAISYVENVRSLSHKLEELSIITVGIKNIDVARYLSTIDLPEKLFIGVGDQPSKIRALWKEEAPILSDKIITHIRRKIIRLKPKAEPMFLL